MSSIHVVLDVSGLHPVAIPCGSNGVVLFKDKHVDEDDAVTMIPAGIYGIQIRFEKCREREAPGLRYFNKVILRLRPQDEVHQVEFRDVKVEHNTNTFETQEHRWKLMDGPPFKARRDGPLWVTLRGGITLSKSGIFTFREEGVDGVRIWDMIS